MNPNTTSTVSTRYRVRQMKSGYASGTKYNVWDTARKGRVNVHAYASRRSAQMDADELNIQDMVKDFAEDPRPYAVRLNEARRLFTEARDA